MLLYLKIFPAFIFSLLLIHSSCQSQVDTLTPKFRKIFKADSLPGLSVILVSADKIIYQHSFGFADIKHKIRYDTSTIQNIGSVSKSFIATAVMKAVDLHYFTLDTYINDILPFKVVNPNFPDHKITIRELATHTSGIVDNPSIYPNSYKFHFDLRNFSNDLMKIMEENGYAGKVTDTTMDQFFYNYFDAKGNYFSADNFIKDSSVPTYTYSNIGSALAAYIVEIKSNMSFADFSAKYELQPLKMDHSAWRIGQVDIKKHAREYFNNEMDFPLYSLLTYPDGGLRTSANELSKYLREMIKGSQGRSTLISPSSYKQMFLAQFSTLQPPRNINLSNRNKGIFWNLYYNGTIGLDGDDPGISTYLFFDPMTGTGGLFLCNKYLDAKQSLVNVMTEALKIKR